MDPLVLRESRDIGVRSDCHGIQNILHPQPHKKSTMRRLTGRQAPLPLGDETCYVVKSP